MEQENQTVEWKEVWRDEYLAWICGYANAKGGVLYIGKNDRGAVVGVSNATKLLEDLPNKVRDVLGIIVDVELCTENGLDYIKITVEPYPSPVNYKGEFHYRTGSTKQILRGNALNKFLLEKGGMKWDALPVPGVGVEDLDPVAFEQFRKTAARTERIDTRDLARSEAELLDSLHLYEKGLLKRAAVLLFHPQPERFFTGSYIKIGFFRNDTDLAFQDEVKGSLFRQIEGTVDLLKTKYFQATISYQDLNRVEQYPYPDKALREALLNAVAHKDYSSGNPIQIRVYPDKLHIWNEGQIPVEWSLERFFGVHPSKPANPDIANTFFRAGLIEAWGRGIQVIVTECKNYGIPKPSFRFDFDGVGVEFMGKANSSLDHAKSTSLASILSDPESRTKLLKFIATYYHHKKEMGAINEDEIAELLDTAKNVEPKSLKIIIELAKSSPQKRNELMASVQLTSQTRNAKRYLDPLLDFELVSPTIKERPQSRNQQYQLTDKGKKLARILTEAYIYNNTRLS